MLSRGYAISETELSVLWVSFSALSFVFSFPTSDHIFRHFPCNSVPYISYCGARYPSTKTHLTCDPRTIPPGGVPEPVRVMLAALL